MRINIQKINLNKQPKKNKNPENITNQLYNQGCHYTSRVATIQVGLCPYTGSVAPKQVVLAQINKQEALWQDW